MRLILLLALLPSLTAAAEPAKNLLLVTLDGVRWQDVFGGYDPLLNTKEAGGVGSPAAVEKRYRRDSAEASRAALMPFLWNTVARDGVVFGDRGVGHVGAVTNPHRFSYPGYSELTCGFVDPRIDSNKKVPNPNVDVLEWLNRQPAFKGRVAVYGAWDVIAASVNPGRSGIHAVAGWDPITPFGARGLSERELALNDLLATSTRHWPDECPDAITAAAALEHVARHKPRVLWVSLGEPDEWAHGRRYDLYTESLGRCDAFVERLWKKAQQMPEYAGTTALVVTTDHGRGSTPADWISHGPKVAGAEGWWLAAMGPGVAATGVAPKGQSQQAQTAATIARLLGQDWNAAEPRAAKALEVGAQPRR